MSDDMESVFAFIREMDRDDRIDGTWGPSLKKMPPPTEEMLKEIPEIKPGVPAGGGQHKLARDNGLIVSTLFLMRNQIKLYHWQTTSFAQHKTTDELVKTLDANIDAFVESYMGTYGRPVVGKTFPLKNLTAQGMKAYLRKTRTFLIKTLPSKIDPEDTDLLAIRDTILGDVDKAMYLFTLA
jgi:hypothetical protein